MKKVSVIVPVYNGTKYLHECLNSLLAQTLPELEVILVNDASTDDSLSILKEYEKKAPDRFIVLDSEKNRGAGGARNLGLSKASGEYIGFMDCDDLAASDMFLHLYESAKKYPGGYDMVECGYDDQEKDLAVIYVTDEMVGKVTAKTRRELIASGGYLWNRIVKREFFQRREAVFRENCILEDADILTWLFSVIGTVGQCKEILYRYMNRGESLSHERSPKRSYKNLYQAMKAEYEKVSGLSVWPEIRDAVEYGILQMYHLAIQSSLLVAEQEGDKEQALSMLKDLRALKRKLITGSYENPYVKAKMSDREILIMKANDREPMQLIENLHPQKKQESGATAEERSAKKLEEGKFEEAISVAWEGIEEKPQSYELFFAAGIAEEELHHPADAFYLYQSALHLAKDQNRKEDEETIRQSFDRLCGYADTTEYALGKAFQKLLQNCFIKKAYHTADLLIQRFLYHSNPGISKPVLTEENMLLAMLSEIVLCEERRNGAIRTGNENSAIAYGCDPYRFREAYRRLTFAFRRIWFGFPKEKQRELFLALGSYPVSSDMLAVVAKYSVPEAFWGDLFERLISLLSEEKPDLAAEAAQYLTWMKNSGLAGNAHCREITGTENEALIRKLCYDPSYNRSGRDLKEEKIAVIFCTNDRLYASECEEYLKRLRVPAGFELEILEIKKAPGMAAGYNFACANTDARYKLYIHHDTFLVCPDLLTRLVECFRSPENPGMIGIFGSRSRQENALWYQAPKADSELNLYQDGILTFLLPKTEENGPVFRKGEMLDGAFLATDVDLPWEEEVFTGWHFYDMAQCRRMQEAGYLTGFLIDREPWALHESTLRRDPENLYELFRKKFINRG